MRVGIVGIVLRGEFELVGRGAVATHLHQRRAEAGVRQGQVGTGVYVILSGSVRVLRGSDELARLAKGDFFGELSVIDQKPRYASVEAAEPTQVLALASWDLLALLETDAQLGLNMIKGLVARIRHADDLLGR